MDEIEHKLSPTEIMAKDVPEGARIVAHTVPTRAFRVVCMPGDKTFRVEQLVPNIWKWQSLSTHMGDDEWESFGPAMQDAIDKQEELKQAIIRERIKQKQNALVMEQGNGFGTRQ